MQANNPTETDQGDEIDILALIRQLWGNKRQIIVIVFAALLLGVFLILRATPIYQANMLIQLEVRSGTLGLPEGMQDLLGGESSGSAAIETETEIIRSRMVLGQAVQQLGLEIQTETIPMPILGQLPQRLGLPDLGIFDRYASGNEKIVVGELDILRDWEGEELDLTITGPGAYRLTLPDGTSVDGRVGERLVHPPSELSLIVEELEGPEGRGFLLRRLSIEGVVREIQLEFVAQTVSRGATILRLIYKHPNPREAERVLDAIADAYVRQNIERSAAEADSSLRFIEEQLPIAQAEMDKAEQALNVYRQTQQSVDVAYETVKLLEKAAELETELTRITFQEEELSKRYTPNHPTYQLLLENRATLEAQLEDIRKQTSDLPATQREIFNLSRDLDVAQKAYFEFVNRSQELRVVRASSVGSVRIIDSAYSDGIKISPKTVMILGLSLVMGTVIGIIAVLIRLRLHRGIRGAEEIERIGMPVFGTINLSADAAGNKSKRGILPIHTLENSDDLIAEAMRSIRTSLHFGMLDAKTNSVLLTSTAPGAGKSFTAVNLAVIAAQAGQRVCLIDADMRRGYMRRYFGRDKGTPGLSELLSGEKTLDEVLLPGPIDTLSVILSGRYPPNPSELLMRAEFGALLGALNERFDLILIDSPPVLAVTDPVVIGRMVGATIMVVRHLETEIGEIEAARRMFTASGCKVAGAILNGYRPEEASRYGGATSYNYRYDYRSSDK